MLMSWLIRLDWGGTIQRSIIGMLWKNIAGFVSSSLLGTSLKLLRDSLTRVLHPPHSHYSLLLELDSSTPSSMFSLFWKSLPCLNPLGSFLFMSLPPSSSGLYFWVDVSVSIFANLGVLSCLLHSGQSFAESHGSPLGLLHDVCLLH